MNNRAKPRNVPLEEIPNKIYYSISEVSDFTGVEPHVLRYWETKFSRLTPKRVGGNQRKYTRNDLELLQEIVHLLYQEGYTLDGAERKLRGGLQALRAEREAEKASTESQDAPSRSHSEAPAVTERQSTHPTPSKSQPGNGHPNLQDIKRELQDILKLLG